VTRRSFGRQANQRPDHRREQVPKQGDRSVGVAGQWTGRLSKADNCQVAVFGVLTDGDRHTPIDPRL
jgi:SRSO17 transposase